MIRQGLDAGIVDELHIIVAPVILGGGKHLFQDFTKSVDLENRRRTAVAVGDLHRVRGQAVGPKARDIIDTPNVDDAARIGLCGFTMGFQAYVREYGLVEIQQTFYEPPRDATMRRWRALAPADFEFTIKAWQLVTHGASSPTYRRLRSPLTDVDRAGVGGFRTTPVVLRAWDRTLECAAILRATAILLQSPASFRPTEDNIDRLRSFFGTIERPSGVRILWEPRGSWPADIVAALCRDLGLVHVVDPFVSTTVTPEQTYFRLHGITGARHVYSDAELEQLADMLPAGEGRPGTCCSTTFLASRTPGVSGQSCHDAAQRSHHAAAGGGIGRCRRLPAVYSPVPAGTPARTGSLATGRTGSDSDWHEASARLRVPCRRCARRRHVGERGGLRRTGRIRRIRATSRRTSTATKRRPRSRQRAGASSARLVDDNTIHYVFTYGGLEGGNSMFAHVHFGGRAIAGGVSFFLCGGSTKPAACPNVEGTVEGDITSADIVGPDNQGIEIGSFGEIVRAMRAGTAYANIHTTRWPGGEIRGQINDADQKQYEH